MKKRSIALLLASMFFFSSCASTTATSIEVPSTFIESFSEEMTSNIEIESFGEDSSEKQLKPGMTDKRTPEEIPLPTVSLSNLLLDEQIVYEYDLIFPLENSYLSYPQFKYIKNNAITEKINAMIFEAVGEYILSENLIVSSFEITFRMINF